MPGICSVIRTAGPVADEKELEYISALHQTCTPSIRKNGTLSSADISRFLYSKYGIVIDAETAKDIACNLCGARRSQEKKQIVVSRIASLLKKKDLKSEAGVESDWQEEPTEVEDEEVYFDIVQIMALLLIPNILEHAQDEESEIFDTVINCMLEPLYDDDEESLRNSGELDMETLRKILMGAGDTDTANNEELMSQMIETLKQAGPFNTESFKRCLTSDVKEGFEKDSNTSISLHTSTFYDVFGCNWEKAKDKWRNFTKVPTLSFVDYANDSIYSKCYNTLLWALFFFTIVYYWLLLGKAEIDSKMSSLFSSCEGFGCEVLKKTLSWCVTGLVVGTFGLFIILSYALPNIAEKNRKKRTLISTSSILSISIIPFILLIVYHKNSPHNPITTTTYFNVCPPSWVKDSSIPLIFDDYCDFIKPFCLRHKELQGKKLMKSLFTIDYEETKTCIESMSAYELFIPAHYCVRGQCDINGTLVCSDDSDCELSNYRGACGYLVDAPVNETKLEKTCCPSGAITLTDNGPICTSQPPGQPCSSNTVCEGFCQDGFCVHNNNKTLAIGSNCTNHRSCGTRYCSYEGVCAVEPMICPSFLNELEEGRNDDNLTKEELEDFDLFAYILAQTKVVPACISEERFCRINNYEMEDNFCRDAALPVLNYTGYIIHKPNSSSNFVVETDDNHNRLESTLDDIWGVLSLVMAGALAVAIFLLLLHLYFFGNLDRERDYRSKHAAHIKSNMLVKNALSMHSYEGDQETEGMTMRNYYENGAGEETIGGMLWTIASIKSGDLGKNYGIRIPSRLYIANFVQIITLIVLVVAASVAVSKAKNEVEKYRLDMRPLTQADLDKMTLTEFYDLSTKKYLSAYVSSEIFEDIPEGWMVLASLIPGIILGTFVSLYCIIVYIPSYVSTVLQMRTGTIQTFHDTRFSELRNGSDRVNLNLGNIFFSMIGCFLLTILIIGIAIFAFAWQTTRSLALSLLSLGIGIGISSGLKIILQTTLRSRNFEALYRKDIVGANASNVFFECWYIATATLTVAVRIGVVIARLCLAMGRLDISFVHPDVGADAHADSFRREILVSEAHNHPYLDRLSGLYLRRLRDGQNFGTAAGQAWRSLFVLGLCPWMIKHRANIASLSSKKQKSIEIDEDFNTTKSADVK